MADISVALPPPKYWEDFEEITLEVFQRRWDDDDAALHGRSGQRQDGVDIYGHDIRGRPVGVQCKRRSLFNKDNTPCVEDALSEKVLRDEASAAEAFTPRLHAFILATTLPRDVHLQKVARKVSKERKDAGKFGVTIWFWTDTLDMLNRNGELLSWYFKHLVHPAARVDPDRLILGVLESAFARPAFTTRMHVENGGSDFLKAMSDTQQALNTGLLITRDGEVVERASNYRRLSNPHWIKRLTGVGRLVQEARDEYTRADKAGEIRHEGYLAVADVVADRLNRIRADALRELNAVLLEAGMDPVDSPLLDL